MDWTSIAVSILSSLGAAGLVAWRAGVAAGRTVEQIAGLVRTVSRIDDAVGKADDRLRDVEKLATVHEDRFEHHDRTCPMRANGAAR